MCLRSWFASASASAWTNERPDKGRKPVPAVWAFGFFGGWSNQRKPWSGPEWHQVKGRLGCFSLRSKGDRIQKPHDRLSGKVSLAGANKIQSGRLCYFTQSCGCRGFAEIAPGCPCEIARHSGKQCSIGFPPVSIRTIGDAFQVFAVSDLLMFREYHANSGESKFLDLCPRRIVLSGRHNLLSGG
jgi:hypothetical protein